MTIFSNAIVRPPTPSLINGLTSSNLGVPDYSLALKQHTVYTETIKQLGLKVQILPGMESYPDSTFIEDVALCTPSCAVITNPGADSRRGEIVGIRKVLAEYYSDIHEITFPGTIEAGDVLMVRNIYFIGISKRTNTEGADQLTDILDKHNMKGIKIPLTKMLHLKSGVSYLENNIVLILGELSVKPEFAGFEKIIVDDNESYAANSLWINGKVLIPEGFPETRYKIERAGFETIVLDVSEFRKLDGGLSCLSLRF